MEIDLKSGKDGVLLAVRLTPRGHADAVVGARDGVLLVSVCAPPADGEANAALLEVLSAALHVPKSALAIARGHKSRDKMVRMSGLPEVEIRTRLRIFNGEY